MHCYSDASYRKHAEVQVTQDNEGRGIGETQSKCAIQVCAFCWQPGCLGGLEPCPEGGRVRKGWIWNTACRLNLGVWLLLQGYANYCLSKGAGEKRRKFPLHATSVVWMLGMDLWSSEQQEKTAVTRSIQEFTSQSFQITSSSPGLGVPCAQGMSQAQQMPPTSPSLCTNGFDRCMWHLKQYHTLSLVCNPFSFFNTTTEG